MNEKMKGGGGYLRWFGHVQSNQCSALVKKNDLFKLRGRKEVEENKKMTC